MLLRTHLCPLRPGRLGANGAGKTTTLSMLTGLLPPTSGDALVDGLSIRNEIDGMRTGHTPCSALPIPCTFPWRGPALLIPRTVCGADIRTALGVCPQLNTLFPQLTPTEHFRLYGAIRGLKGEALDAAVASLLVRVQVCGPRDVPPSVARGVSVGCR